MKLIHKLSAAVVSSGLMLTMFASAAFADEIVISGNGVDSTNIAVVANVNLSKVEQSNFTMAGTMVSSEANTGNNTANGNTGGDVTIDTGNGTSTVNTTVTGSSNSITSSCGCQTPSTDIKIKDNGVGSLNVAGAVNISASKKTQKNGTIALTGISSKAKTGKNKANGNTDGSTEVKTGSSTSTVNTTVTGSSNIVN